MACVRGPGRGGGGLAPAAGGGRGGRALKYEPREERNTWEQCRWPRNRKERNTNLFACARHVAPLPPPPPPPPPNFLGSDHNCAGSQAPHPHAELCRHLAESIQQLGLVDQPALLAVLRAHLQRGTDRGREEREGPDEEMEGMMGVEGKRGERCEGGVGDRRPARPARCPLRPPARDTDGYAE